LAERGIRGGQNQLEMDSADGNDFDVIRAPDMEPDLGFKTVQNLSVNSAYMKRNVSVSLQW
jgi:hypothetical protein